MTRVACWTLAWAALAGCSAPEPAASQPARGLRSARPVGLKVLAVRLLPGEDPKRALEKLVADEKIEAAFVLSCAGSLTRAVVRFADQKDAQALEGHFEIVSLSGTLSATGGSHLHVSISDGAGKTLGGHLKDGSAVYTTAEIAVGILDGTAFTRAPDPRTTWPELFVETR